MTVFLVGSQVAYGWQCGQLIQDNSVRDVSEANKLDQPSFTVRIISHKSMMNIHIAYQSVCLAKFADVSEFMLMGIKPVSA